MDKLDYITYINLDYRTDRNQHMVDQFNTMGVTNYTRTRAIKTKYGPYGCCMSHLKALYTIRKNGYKYSMILEDDAKFLINSQQLNSYLSFFIKDESHIMCLGYNTSNTEPYSVEMLRTYDTVTASCYVVKLNIIEDLIKVFEESKEAMEKHNMIGHPLDDYWKKIQFKYKFIIPKKRAVLQIASYSDNANSFTNYGV